VEILGKWGHLNYLKAISWKGIKKRDWDPYWFKNSLFSIRELGFLGKKV